MKSLNTWFDEYAVSHQNPINKLIHWICVPSIFFSIVALVSSIPHESLQNLLPSYLSWAANWAGVAIVFVMLFYFRLSMTMGLAMTAFSGVCLIGAEALTFIPIPVWASALVIFAAAWVGQFIGHHIEGKKPSFLKDLQFLLIGPAWLMGFVFRAIGLRY